MRLLFTEMAMAFLLGSVHNQALNFLTDYNSDKVWGKHLQHMHVYTYLTVNSPQEGWVQNTYVYATQ